MGSVGNLIGMMSFQSLPLESALQRHFTGIPVPGFADVDTLSAERVSHESVIIMCLNFFVLRKDACNDLMTRRASEVALRSGCVALRVRYERL